MLFLDAEVINQRTEISLPTTLKEIRRDYLGMFKYAPLWCRKRFLSPAGLLFFLSWGSTIQVNITQLQFQRNRFIIKSSNKKLDLFI